MEHPKFRCPDYMKPVFIRVRVHLARVVSRDRRMLPISAAYICFGLTKELENAKTDLERERVKACKTFIEESLGAANTVGEWLYTNDPEYRSLSFALVGRYDKELVLRVEANKARLAWLNYLIGDTPCTQ